MRIVQVSMMQAKQAEKGRKGPRRLHAGSAGSRRHGVMRLTELRVPAAGVQRER